MPRTKKAQTDELINFYELPEIKKNQQIVSNPNFNLTQIKIPCRMGVIAFSGGGKSNFVMNFIILSSLGKGTFSHIHIVHKLDEDLYDLLAKTCQDQLTFYKKLSDLPEPKDLEGLGHQLVFLDDVIADKNQDKIERYFIFSRKIKGGLGCSCIYISQKYYSIPKIVRGQFNYIILLKIKGERDLKNSLNDCQLGIDVDELEEIHKDATKDDLNFLKISCVERDENKMLSKNFTKFYQIN